MSSQTQDARAEQTAEQRRRKRKERAAKSRTPEPKNIVSGAGQPLDPGLRRELEEQLGHDLGRVRLHTGRDAGQLTELLGADAVAVGQDVFFREGAFKPGTDEGRRLLTHELQHTVQNPHGLGTLRAGRELGAVSLPQQAIEREAEAAAQAVVQASEEAPQVEEGQATPGWLRYTTVDADRMRAEAIDPATLVDRLAGNVLRSLRGDPTDASGRVRLQLGRMSDRLAEPVLDRLEQRLLSSEYERLLDLFEESASSGPLDLQPGDVPLPEIDLFEELGVERTQWKRQEETRRGSDDQRAEDAREEQKDAKDRDQQAGSQQSRAQSDVAAEDQEAAQRKEQEDERAASRERAEEEQRQEDEQASGERERVDEAADRRTEGQQEGAEEAKEERKEQREREEADPQQASAPGADKRRRRDQQTQPAAGSKREELDPKARAQAGRVRAEKVDERAEQRDSALSEHGLHEKDEHEDDVREEEKPLGLEAGADDEVKGGEADEKGPEAKPEPTIKPEDHLPEADLDLSAVPTADQLQPGAAEPSVPSFPTPPPTKAEKIEREREKDEQERDGDDAVADGPETKAPGQDEGPVEGEAPQPEGGPAALAEDRGAKDLQETEKPLDQEVGPDPVTEDKERPEPEAEKPDPAQEQEQQQAKEPGAEEEPDAGSGDEDERPDAEEQGSPAASRTARTAAEPAERTAEGARAAAAPAAPAVNAAPAPVRKPAGAATPRTAVEDRNPSPAARRAAAPPKPEREAPKAKSQVPQESGPVAAPRAPVGGSEKTPGPTAAAGPGAAPSAAQTGVSPAASPEQAPGTAQAPAPQPEASLEKDGGGCAPPEPAAEPEGGASCGGGGGGQAAAEEKKQEPPDVSGQDPKAAVQTVSKLAPDQAAAAMPGVDQAADKKISEEQQRLDSAPPTRERPSGAPQTRSAPPEAAPAAAPVTGKVEKLGPEDQADKQKAKGSEKAAGEKPSAPPPPPPAVPTEGLSEAEAQNVEAAADAVPTRDPALENKTVGPAPKIRLEGASDPTRTDDQQKALKEKQSDIQATGRDDAAKPMGEDQIFPDAPQEQLTGKASGGPGGGKGGALRAMSPPKAGVGKVAQEEKGGEISGAAGQAQGDLAAKEQEQRQGEQQAKQEKQAEIDREVSQNTEKQTAERGKVARETQVQREQWRSEQDKKVEEADTKSEEEHGKKNKEIVKARDEKDKEVADRKDKDNEKIDTERENAEKEAEKKKEEEKPSGGFFGMLADAVGDFFSALLDAVTAVFEAARAAVNGIIDQFKEWANAAIDFVRDLAISAINALADVLIAIGDVLLAAFPELRDKFRKAIEGMRDAAISAVNQLADGLKKAVNALLDALAAGLNALLTALEAGVKLVIKAYQAVIEGAIKFAQAAIEALGKFAALIADIAPDPGGWLAKAGSSAKSGITDHLWGAIKVAVKRWFDTKVEGILGLGKAVINVLVKGCVSLKQIGKMAWDAIVASLPMMIASLVIEKVVSMLVPAAGAILTIVQGLMAAWQSISSILTAFSKFWAYLKAVKAGPAACLFAEAVAAGVVALLDFIANFLMIRLSSATKGVGERLQDMSQKIMNGLKRTGKGGKQAAGDAVNNARGAMRNANQKVAAPGAATPKPKGATSPAPKAPVKPKDAATPKGPAKADPGAAAKPKDAGPAKSEAPGKDRTPDRDRTPDKDRTPEPSKDKTPGSRDKTPTGDKTPDAPSPKKKKEIEGPKPKKPKKPKSPAKKALSKAKGAVKSALKKVGNAAKTLGNKLKKSKLGKALKDGAKRLRDLFKKKKDRLRDDKRRQQQRKRQDRDRRRKDEKSQDSKQERLNRILPRLRRNLKERLTRGIPERVLRPTLDALRRHYRLTSLTASGNPVVDFDVTLNPGRDLGIDGVRVQPSDKEAQPEDMERPETSDQQIEESEEQSPAGLQAEAPKNQVESSKQGAVVYDRNKTEKEEEDKNPPPYSRMKVFAKRPGAGWYMGQIQSVGKKTFSFYGHGKEGPAEFDVTIKNKGAWSKIAKPGNFKYGRSFEQIRNGDPWSQYDPDARQSLNYRKAYKFKNPGGRKWNWHHIHEQVASGPNTVKNLAYSRDYANQEFNVWMARKQSGVQAPDGTLLPSTGSKSVRKFLKDTGASPETHRKWGLACIRVLGYRIEEIDKGRGLFQQIRK
ncbi:eCIS core domain-containing protein [Streptomyces sp. 4N124]|uniref:eCIS core domain-containing protein n=1 Tax=Streptomyces sp. 4N124 TaxID=3457420 RepID=UPI003FD1E4DA